MPHAVQRSDHREESPQSRQKGRCHYTVGSIPVLDGWTLLGPRRGPVLLLLDSWADVYTSLFASLPGSHSAECAHNHSVSKTRQIVRWFPVLGDGVLHLFSNPPHEFDQEGQTEISRWEWRRDRDQSVVDPLEALMEFLAGHGIPVDNKIAKTTSGDQAQWPAEITGVALLIGAAAGAVSIGGASGTHSPAVGVPDVAAVIYGPGRSSPCEGVSESPFLMGEWETSWTDQMHANAVQQVQDVIAAGDVYQVNVVGHRSAPYSGDPTKALRAVAGLPGASYGGMITGDGWAVATGTPECQLDVSNGIVRTHPIKGTRPATEQGLRELLASEKERAEHIMIVDLERNDLAQVAVPGSVTVDRLFVPQVWCDVWQAESIVSARLRPDVGLADLLRAVLPGGSVTGAPKLAALDQIARLEPVGRGPAMGALGFFTKDRLQLGLTIRSVAADGERLHVWAGGGITWDSVPELEVAEAHAKAAPLLAAIAEVSGR